MKARKKAKTLSSNLLIPPFTTAGKIRIGINGFARIGRLVARAVLMRDDIDVVAINDPSLTVKDMVAVFKADNTDWHWKQDGISFQDSDSTLLLGGKPVTVYSYKEPEEIPWANVGAEYIIESTGAFTDKEKAAVHLKGGAKKVIITACSEDAPLFIMGINEHEYKPELDIISTANGTTNCVAPLAKVIHDRFGIVNGFFTRFDSIVVHSTDIMDQRLPASTIPSISGADKAIGKVLPSLEGKLTEQAFPSPTLDVSRVDLTVQLEKVATNNQIIAIIKEESENKLKGILRYLEDDVSIKDLTWDSSSSIVEAHGGTVFCGNFLKIVAINSNDWGYSIRVVDLIARRRLIKHLLHVFFLF